MAKNDRLQNEQEHHKNAFETYYAVGPKRTYKQLAQKLDVSPRTVKLWAMSFRWQERMTERDATVARRVADRTLKSGVDELERNTKIIEMAIIRLAKAIAEGKVGMHLADLERLIRLQQLLDRRRDTHGIPNSGKELLAHMEYIMSSVSTAVLDEAIALMKEREAKPWGHHPCLAG